MNLAKCLYLLEQKYKKVDTLPYNEHVIFLSIDNVSNYLSIVKHPNGNITLSDCSTKIYNDDKQFQKTRQNMLKSESEFLIAYEYIENLLKLEKI